MLTTYIQAAMQHATYEWLPEDGLYYAEIPELPGVWATSSEREAFSSKPALRWRTGRLNRRAPGRD